MYCNFKSVSIYVSVDFILQQPMSGPNPNELGKSQIQENPITRSQVKKNNDRAKFVAQNQTGPLKPKRTVTVKEKVTKDNLENISNKDKTNISF